MDGWTDGSLAYGWNFLFYILLHVMLGEESASLEGLAWLVWLEWFFRCDEIFQIICICTVLLQTVPVVS